jgi:hypothetical protein
VAPQVIVFDESKHSRHRVLSVGGIVFDFADLQAIEAEWLAARWSAGIPADAALKYSMSWPEGPDQRSHLIEAIARLPVRALISLLEDFRPLRMKAPGKATRKDSYIQCKALEYALQRLAGDLYVSPADAGPHLVMIDDRDDFAQFKKVYVDGHRDGWPHLPHHPMPPLSERGFSASLGVCSNGPLHEIADLLVSCTTRWADERCMNHKGGKAPDLEELDRCMSQLVRLFPAGQGGLPPRRCGHSVVVHAGNRTGKELLRDNVDRWMNDLTSGGGSASDPRTEIPF